MLILIAAALGACEPTDVRAALIEAASKYRDGDYASAWSVVAGARTNLACAPDIPLPPDLALLYQIGGVSAAQTNRADVALEWYSASARVASRPTWDARFGRSVPPEFLTFLDAPNDATVTANSDLWVDGFRLFDGQPLSTKSGAHLVQWRSPDGLVHGEVVEVGTGSSRIGPVLAAPPVAKKPSKTARIAVGAAGAAVAVGAGVVFWEALNQSRGGDYELDETLMRVGAVALGVGVGGMLVSTVFLDDGTPGIGVSGQF